MTIPGKIYIAFLTLFVAFSASAQKDTLFIVGQGKVYPDSLVLRWNALSAESFIRVLDSGFVSELYEQTSTGFKLVEKKQSRMIMAGDLKGKTLDSNSLKMAGILYTLRNLPVPPANAGFQVLKTYQDQKNMLWGAASFMADLYPDAAEAAGLRYVYKQRNRNTRYLYRIYAFSNIAVSDTLMGFFPEGNPDLSRNIDKQFYFEEGELNVQVSAEIDRKFSGYWLEKKGSAGFRKTTDIPQVIPAAPAIFVTLSDSFEQNYRPAEFRIAACDMFGDIYYGPIFKAKGRDQTPPNVVLKLSTQSINDSIVKIDWDISKGLKSDVYRTKVSRSELPEGPFTKVTEIRDFTGSFNDIAERGASGYYYLLEALDTAGNATRKLSYNLLPDSKGPQQPQSLRALVDSNGVVLLHWDHVPDADLKGYLVFKANDLKHEFSGIVSFPQKENYLLDTLPLNMLNRNIYYRIIAVDKHFNQSVPSAIIKVLRPDTIAPVSPQIIQYQVKDSSVQLELQASSSADVRMHYLYRLQDSKKELIDSFSMFTRTISYIDHKVNPGMQYAYFMDATDSTGNRSLPGNQLRIMIPRRIVLPETPMLNLTYDSSKRQVNIAWKQPNIQNAMIHIYRGNAADSMQYLRTLPANLMYYKDSLFSLKGSAYYSAAFVDAKGVMGKMSEPLLLRKD